MGKYPIMFIHVSQFQMECDIQMIASHREREGVEEGILSKSCKDRGKAIMAGGAAKNWICFEHIKIVMMMMTRLLIMRRKAVKSMIPNDTVM